VMMNAQIRSRETHCSQALITRPFLSIGVVAVQGLAPLEIALQKP
jgi:hypothetical protein